MRLPPVRLALSRLGWFIGIWAASVAALGLVAAVLRFWLR
ncbi:MAG: DUF2474 family protein [Sphingobium sp.]|nr:DUF2474 family protein [Sphingobium sp.]